MNTFARNKKFQCWSKFTTVMIALYLSMEIVAFVDIFCFFYRNSFVFSSIFFFQGIHVMEYIRSRCDVSPLIPIDLCLIHSGEPINLSSFDSKLLSVARDDLPSHLRCVLARIDGHCNCSSTSKTIWFRSILFSFFFLEQGAYIPLLNSSKLVTNEFLAKMKRATNSKNSPKSVSKPNKQTPGSPVKQSPGSGTKQTSNGSNKQSSNSPTKQPPSSPTKQSSSTTPKPPQMKRRRSLKAIAIAATLAASNSHQ